MQTSLCRSDLLTIDVFLGALNNITQGTQITDRKDVWGGGSSTRPTAVAQPGLAIAPPRVHPWNHPAASSLSGICYKELRLHVYRNFRSMVQLPASFQLLLVPPNRA